MSGKLITDVSVVLPERVLDPGWVYLEDGIIIEIGAGFKRTGSAFTVPGGGGTYLMPGLVDIHCDAIEKEIQPRPAVLLDVEIACREVERKMAIHGITTIFHSLSFSAGEGVRSDELASEAARYLAAMQNGAHLIRNRVHLRYEISNTNSVEILQNLLQQGVGNLLSYMDHTPGQGQYRTIDDYLRYVRKTYWIEEEACRELLAQKFEERKKVDEKQLRDLSRVAGLNNVPLASHDDDSREKVEEMRNLGATIAEFPVNLETAFYARSLGMQVCVGAPNLLRGRSHENNLNAAEALEQGAADILCSDYHPPALLYGVFKLAGSGFGLPAATCAATLNGARSTGLGHCLGSIEAGKKADLILVRLVKGKPVVLATLVEGQEVARFNYSCNGKWDSEILPVFSRV